MSYSGKRNRIGIPEELAAQIMAVNIHGTLTNNVIWIVQQWLKQQDATKKPEHEAL